MRREKAIYHTLNKLSMDTSRKVLLAEAWCPLAAKPHVHEALRRAAQDSSTQVRERHGGRRLHLRARYGLGCGSGALCGSHKCRRDVTAAGQQLAVFQVVAVEVEKWLVVQWEVRFRSDGGAAPPLCCVFRCLRCCSRW